MDLIDPTSHAEAVEFLNVLRSNIPLFDEDTLRDVVERVQKLYAKYNLAFEDVAGTVEDLCKDSIDKDVYRRAINFLKDYTFKCKVKASRPFVVVGILAHTFEDEKLSEMAAKMLTTIRSQVYNDDVAFFTALDGIKDCIVPKMKTLAESKQFSGALAIWRIVVSFTRLERIPTALTNGILQIATLAFKEIDASVHIDALKSWKVLVENLPRSLLKKPAYIKLLLNPLNRFYPELDCNTDSYKYSAWWQLVLSLGDDIEEYFDEVVLTLLTRVFVVPSSRSRLVNPASAGPTRELPQSSYVLFALLLYRGDAEIYDAMSSLDKDLPINPHVIRDSCFSKRQNFLEELVDLILNNITSNVTPPSEFYSFLLAKIFLYRIPKLYDEGHCGLIRIFLSTVYKLIQSNLFNIDQMLNVFTDLANGIPQKVMVSPQYNLSGNSSSMHECPLMTLTAFFVAHVARMCEEEPPNSSTKRPKMFRLLLKALLDCGGSGVNFLFFSEHVVKSLAIDSGSLRGVSWLEIADHLKIFIMQSHEVNQGSSLEHDFSALTATLKFPFRSGVSFTTEMLKVWNELFTLFSVDAALVKGISPNQHIEELCAHLLGELNVNELDLNHLLLFGQAFETIVKHTELESAQAGKKVLLGNLHSLINSIALLAKQGYRYLNAKKQSKANSMFFVCIVNLATSLIQRTSDISLCRFIVLAVIPDLLPLIEHTKTKTSCRETALLSVEPQLLDALGNLVTSLLDKAERLCKHDGAELNDIVFSVCQHGVNHRKNNIREASINYARKSCLEFPVTDQSSQSSQTISIPDVIPPSLVKVSGTPKNISNTRSRVTRSTNKEEDQVYTPIKTAKKKHIYTEHQLEKLSESKVLPSMYEDLSQSLEKDSVALSSTKSSDTVSSLISEPIIDENALFNDITPKKSGKQDLRKSAESSCANFSVCNVSSNREVKNSDVIPCDKNDFERKEIVNYKLSETDKDMRNSAVLADISLTKSNNENEQPAPKKRKRSLFQDSDYLPRFSVADDQQILQSKISDNKSADCDEADHDITPILVKVSEENDLQRKPQGARKRKLRAGQTVESPVTTKLHHRNMMLHSPSSRSRMMLEAAQARLNGNVQSATCGGSPDLNKGAIRASIRTPQYSSPLTTCGSLVTRSNQKSVQGKFLSDVEEILPEQAGDCSTPPKPTAQPSCGVLSSTKSPTPSSNALMTIPTECSTSLITTPIASVVAVAAGSPMSPSTAGRSILKRATTGASSKKVSFSSSNEVCAYNINPRISAACSLLPPVVVHTENRDASSEGLTVGSDKEACLTPVESNGSSEGDSIELSAKHPRFLNANLPLDYNKGDQCGALSSTSTLAPLDELPQANERNSSNSRVDANESEISKAEAKKREDSDASLVYKKLTLSLSECFSPIANSVAVTSASESNFTLPTLSAENDVSRPEDDAVSDRNLQPASLTNSDSEIAPSLHLFASNDLIQRVKAAQAAHLESLLEFISSDEFIQKLTPNVRGSFFARCLQTISSYQLR